MATVRVEHTIGDLAADMARIPTRGARAFVKTVKKNTEQGKRLAQQFARESSGPHGKFYFKRITSEMITPLEGEYGPTGDVQRAVGAGWRHGPPNTDLPRSADIQGPKFANDIGNDIDGLFW